ncbi:hypothetical protein N7452_009717 [Penicillium brevicompactum]|uniref:Uncharacterized protein n=1 Tax=Penicillium brevicompactum TaxID=5074 RepID=A0A9W9UAC6_PENBR|nr:hypothetical protein N7452_009717 [Penicillium brevicompactum]
MTGPAKAAPKEKKKKLAGPQVQAERPDDAILLPKWVSEAWRLKTLPEYKEARAKLVTFLKDQARLIRNQPNSTSVREAQINLRESGVELLDDLARAALMVSCEALDHPLVTAKPFGFYNDHVINQCILLKGALLVLSNGL